MEVLIQNVILIVSEGLLKSYGLDWITMFFGVLGAYYITRKDKRGIAFNIMSCISSFSLAILCNQYGYVIYNIIFAVMMMRAYMDWSKEKIVDV